MEGAGEGGGARKKKARKTALTISGVIASIQKYYRCLTVPIILARVRGRGKGVSWKWG